MQFPWKITRNRTAAHSATGLTIPSYKPSINSGIVNKEEFKGEVTNSTQKINFSDVGVPHPFPFEVTEKLYKEFGLVTGVVDKYIDFVIGPGFFIKTENTKAEEILLNFMKNVNFDTILRAWLKEALIKGTGFIEMASDTAEGEPTKLKILDAKRMFIERDVKGNITGFNQLKTTKRFTAGKDNVISFTTDEVAELALNVTGDMAYGLGIIWPSMKILDNLFELSANMNLLMRRKANAPIVARIGDKEHFPDKDAVSDFGNDMEVMSNKTEWAVDFLVDLKVLDFGNIGEKFEVPLRYYKELLFATYQVPEVLLGQGNISEGLAGVQLEAFDRRIQSIQAEIEKVIENKIFKRVLIANGIEAEVEFEWGQPSIKEKNERVKTITELLKNPMLDFRLRSMLEIELASLMGLNAKELETPEEERTREEAVPLPIIPGENRKEIYFGELVI